MKLTRSTYTKSLFLILLALSRIQAQNSVMEVAPPLEIPLAISGTFGEIRSNHFHAGIDIKTQGRQGLNVRSVAKGWVNRIRISHGGYGKALYIEHADGYISVYAHLKKFSPEIEAYVKAKQYEKKSYEIQLFPKFDALKVEKGMLIGYSGNTGGSQGPHLHFELRDRKNQNPLNPLIFDLPVKDTQAPRIQKLFLYRQNSDGTTSIQKQIVLNRKNDSLFTESLVETSGNISLGLQMFDRQDLSYNKNGIYKARIQMNGVTQIEYDFDRISFDDSKFINLFIDYKTLRTAGLKIQRLVRHRESKKSIFNNKYANGFMQIEEGKSYQIIVEISDYNGNSSFIEFYIFGKESNLNKITTSGKEIKKDLDYLFEFKKKSVYFPKETFSEKVRIEIKDREDTITVGKDIFPINKPFKISFKKSFNDQKQLRQSFVAMINSKNRLNYLPTEKKDGILIAKSKKLGDFVISRDSIAPEVSPKNFKKGQWLSNFRYLEVKIKDDFSGIKKYRGSINGQWVLFEYE
ncbi:M23 family metallopeptidase, partial [Flavobacteriaceae bacterium]|nr:M23 family metallopeptidase [Flavobacteriaceae bacterium]